jgi:hypothetical protein
MGWKHGLTGYGAVLGMTVALTTAEGGEKAED